MLEKYTYKSFFEKPPLKPCFLAGTLVQTINGMLPIEQIVVGTEVFCYDEILQELTTEKIIETYKNYTEKYLIIGTQSGESLKVTGQHLFYQKATNSWVKANQLTIGMYLFNPQSNSTDTILTLQIIEEKVDTYNLEVAKYHNYIVGKAGILAHNGPSYADLSTRKYAFYRLFTLDSNDKAETKYIGKTTRKDLNIRNAEHSNHGELKGPDSKHYWKYDEKPQIRNLNQGKPALEFIEMTEFESAIFEKYYWEDYRYTTKSKLRNIQNPISKKSFKKYKALHKHLNPCIYFV